MKFRLCVAALVAAMAIPAASAHTSYLLPTVFTTAKGNFVTLQASFTDDFATPEIAVDSDDYHVVSPDGSRDEYKSITPFRQVVILESPLTEEGTYRFTTGARLGRSSKVVLVDGEWKPLFEPGAEVPENATKVITSQTETVADVYVTKGPSTRASVDTTIGRLAIRPDTHPNEIYLDEGFSLDVTFDGAPLVDQTLTLSRNGGDYEAPKFEQELQTDAAGHLNISFDKPGIYLIMTRHRAEAPAGAETDERSYTTSLTFEVLR
ncbi:DUF4198 domain-containing protein [uncultured Hyphomonas sp.]|uniref:DUF4198 domain-containing protein n=1 Tax=uncultured Hyphomonas sp. TaxID=225298 RepID=UPI002AAB4E18|nr:DUF4198 domain-containing protein [uncultured Hyphomonas sp.]